MFRFLTIYLDICLLRAGPQHLPASTSLLVLSLTAYFASSMATEGVLGEPNQALALAFTVTALMVALTLLVLRLRGVMPRARQTISALAGTGALINLIMLPMTLVIAPPAGSTIGPIISIIWLVIFFWSFALDGHILRHALSVSFTEGVLVATVFFAIGVSMNYWLFTGPP